MEQKKENKPNTIGAISALIVLVLVGYFAYQCLGTPSKSTIVSTPTPTHSPPAVTYSTPSSKPGRLQLDVQSAKYQYGFLEVHGVVTNTGGFAIYSPQITIQVWDETGKIKLAEEPAWPAGTFLKYMQPGEQAAIDFYVSVGSEPKTVKYKFLTNDVIYFDVNFPK